MLVSISDAGMALDDLVFKVEAGDEVVLTRAGKAVVRRVPLNRPPFDPAGRRAVLEAARRRGRAEAAGAEAAARSKGFLYGDDCIPG